MRTLAVIMAGGESRRMGGAKPLRRFGAATLIEHALRLARRYAADVVVSVRDPSQIAGADAAVVIDDPAMAGPLAGLAAGLAHAREAGAERVLAIACDMPLLPDDLATRLAAALDATPRALVAVASSGGKLHPACALWRSTALDHLGGYVAQGRSSLRGFAETCGCVVVPWAVGATDPFANANTPEELAQLQPGRGHAI